MIILELFSGTKSFSKVAEKLGHKTFTIDNQAKLKPDLCTDILKLDIKQIPKAFRKPDIIWASPPCIDYSHAKRSGISFIELSNMLVIKSINLILSLNPQFWILENPQTSTLKFQYFMHNLPFTDVSYCNYGYSYRKQTRLWNNFKFSGKKCKKDCEYFKNGKHINSVGNGREKYTNKSFSKVEKGSVPEKLCKDIIYYTDLNKKNKWY